jgi:ribosomal protein S18 acetylase RimI-like enzyme
MGVHIQRATDEQVAEAAKLTADVHARTRKLEPLLPESYADPAGSLQALEGKEDIWVAVEGGRVVAVLACTPGKYGAFSPPLGLAGSPAAMAPLYQAAAADWVARGELTHAVHVPLGAPELIDPFLELGFGYQARYGMHSLTDIPAAPEVPGLTVTPGGAADVEDIVALTRVLPDHLAKSPVFGPRSDAYYAGLRDVHLGNLSKGEGRYFLARLDGIAVGLVITNNAEDGPFDPPGGHSFDFAAVSPELRGTGIGLALTRAALLDAKESGSTGMWTDWRTTNPPAARIWPAVGFKPMCLRLSRRIDLTRYS